MGWRDAFKLECEESTERCMTEFPEAINVILALLILAGYCRDKDCGQFWEYTEGGSAAQRKPPRPGAVWMEGARGKDPSAHRYLLLRPELMLDSSCLSFSTSFLLSA